MTQVQLIDDLKKVKTILEESTRQKLSKDWDFLIEWPSLSEKVKKEKFSLYTSHELNFFLSQKDPEFFREIVQPFIASKFQKTFVDYYLLGQIE